MSAWKPPEGIEAPAFAPQPGRKSLKLPPKTANKTPLIGAAILKLDHFARDVGGGLWVYRDGCYRPGGERAVLQRLRELTMDGDAEVFSRNRAAEVAAWIEADAPTLWECPPLDVVNVRNGLLHLPSRDLRPHSPEHLSAIQIPVAFDQAATCPCWDRFIGDVFPSDSAGLPWELIGWLMVPDNFYKKAPLMLGDGDNGKSAFLRAITAFLGRENVATLSLHELESNRFAPVRLLGKLANICADLPTAHLQGTSVFLAVTGGDSLSGERKYGTSFDFTPFSRLLFSANVPPRAKDATSAFFERWLVVLFEAVFRGENAIKREVLDGMLADPRELSGVLNRAIDGLAALRARGRFDESESMREAHREFRATTDPFAGWWEGAVVMQPGLFIPMRELRRLYGEDCIKHGRPVPSRKAFAAMVQGVMPGLAEGKRPVGGDRVMCYLGIGVRSATYTDEDVRRAGVPIQEKRGGS